MGVLGDVADDVLERARDRAGAVGVEANALAVEGPPVDAVIDELTPHLDEGDTIVDGGNSNFRDTQRRTKAMAEKGLRFLGVGVSGGEEGAGPALGSASSSSTRPSRSRASVTRTKAPASLGAGRPSDVTAPVAASTATVHFALATYITPS